MIVQFMIVMIGYCMQIEQELGVIVGNSDSVPAIITYGQKSTGKSISSQMEELDEPTLFWVLLHLHTSADQT